MHHIANDLYHFMGLNSPNGKSYLFWSGIAGTVSQFVAPIVAVGVGYFKLKAHHDKHQQQLKDHIDYKFHKLAEKEDQ